MKCFDLDEELISVKKRRALPSMSDNTNMLLMRELDQNSVEIGIK